MKKEKIRDIVSLLEDTLKYNQVVVILQEYDQEDLLKIINTLLNENSELVAENRQLKRDMEDKPLNGSEIQRREKLLNYRLHLPNGMYAGITVANPKNIVIFREDRSLFNVYHLEEFSRRAIDELHKEVKRDLAN